MTSPLRPMDWFQNNFTEMNLGWPSTKITKIVQLHWNKWLPELKIEKTFQWRLLLVQWTNFKIILWKYSFGDPLSKLLKSYLVCRLIMMCWMVGLGTSLLLLILPFICPIFFLFILWMKNYSFKISVKLWKLECSYLVCRLIMMNCIVRLRTSFLILIPSCIVQFSSFPYFE